MKHLFLLLLMCFAWCIPGRSNQTESIKKVIERVTGRSGLPVRFKVAEADGKARGKTYFSYQVKNGQLTIKGNSPVAVCHGFYDFIKSQHAGIYSWSGNNIQFPVLAGKEVSGEVVSPFKHHYLFNVVTYGYSMPYWDWERWEKEIDRMALHGVDMPLALVGYEAIISRVWKKMGLTDEEINHYFVGPAHLPWMRMGNISGIDGPLNEDWHRRQISLQHRILKRMKELGMKPVCPGFPGFVPEAFKRLYPGLNLIQTHWGGAFCNWMISPDEPLFGRIGTEFIKEWEKEFGKNEYYLTDSFNEMEIPFPAKGSKERYELVASYGDKVYQSLAKANPKAVWVMQGWMFGYQRDIWDYNTLKALVSKVPDDKMLLLDLAVDYNKNFWKSEVNWEFYKGFYNKPWVYSVIPNMGGKTGPTGILEFYANGHLEALNSPNKGRLTAHGMAPEGIENNEVIYELLSDAGWSSRKIDLRQWLKDYSYNRYGAYPREMEEYWTGMLKSVYGTFTDHPRYNWQLRPGTVRNGSININEAYFKAVEAFVKASTSLKNSRLYRTDLAEQVALYLGGKVELLTKAIDWQYQIGDTTRAVKLENDFGCLMRGMDALLTTHPTLRLERWIDFAHKQAVTPAQRKQYEKNAKRIVTIWGPPVDDYSARVWSGLIRDYYLPRWQHYFDSRKTKRPFDFPAWEKAWVEQSVGCSEVKKPEDVVYLARTLVDYAAFITPDLYPGVSNVVGSWTVEARKNITVSFNLSSEQLRKCAGIRIKLKGGKGVVQCRVLKITADGKDVFNSNTPFILTPQQMEHVLTVGRLSDVRGNNGLRLELHLVNGGVESLTGEVSVELSDGVDLDS